MPLVQIKGFSLFLLISQATGHASWRGKWWRAATWWPRRFDLVDLHNLHLWKASWWPRRFGQIYSYWLEDDLLISHRMRWRGVHLYLHCPLVKMLADNWILGARRSASTTSVDKPKVGSESRSLRCRGGRSHIVQKVNCDRIVTFDIWYDITVIVIYLKYIDIFNNLPKEGVSGSEGPERYFPLLKNQCQILLSCYCPVFSLQFPPFCFLLQIFSGPNFGFRARPTHAPRAFWTEAEKCLRNIVTTFKTNTESINIFITKMETPKKRVYGRTIFHQLT